MLSCTLLSIVHIMVHKLTDLHGPNGASLCTHFCRGVRWSFLCSSNVVHLFWKKGIALKLMSVRDVYRLCVKFKQGRKRSGENWFKVVLVLINFDVLESAHTLSSVMYLPFICELDFESKYLQKVYMGTKGRRSRSSGDVLSNRCSVISV